MNEQLFEIKLQCFINTSCKILHETIIILLCLLALCAFHEAFGLKEEKYMRADNDEDEDDDDVYKPVSVN